MLKYGNKEFRNLQEQVQKNKDDLLAVVKGTAAFGVIFKAVAASTAEVVDPEVDAFYLIGNSEDGYVMYQYTAEGWRELSAIGTGPKGEDGTVWYEVVGEPDAELGNPNDFAFDIDTGDVWHKERRGWMVKMNLIGPAGPQGPEGPEGPQGEKGEKGDPGDAPENMVTTDTEQTITGKKTVWRNGLTFESVGTLGINNKTTVKQHDLGFGNFTLTLPAENGTLATQAYVDSHGGSGAVDSVNGKTGVVVLSAEDIMVKNASSVQANLERIDLEVEGIVDDIADLNSGKLNATKAAVSSVGGLVIPTAAPTSEELVGISTSGDQSRVTIGSGLSLVNGELIATGGSGGGVSKEYVDGEISRVEGEIPDTENMVTTNTEQEITAAKTFVNDSYNTMLDGQTVSVDYEDTDGEIEVDGHAAVQSGSFSAYADSSEDNGATWKGGSVELGAADSGYDSKVYIYDYVDDVRDVATEYRSDKIVFQDTMNDISCELTFPEESGTIATQEYVDQSVTGLVTVSEMEDYVSEQVDGLASESYVVNKVAEAGVNKQDKLDSWSTSASVSDNTLTINYKVRQEDGTYKDVSVPFTPEGGSGAALSTANFTSRKKEPVEEADIVNIYNTDKTGVSLGIDFDSSRKDGPVSISYISADGTVNIKSFYGGFFNYKSSTLEIYGAGVSGADVSIANIPAKTGTISSQETLELMDDDKNTYTIYLTTLTLEGYGFHQDYVPGDTEITDSWLTFEQDGQKYVWNSNRQQLATQIFNKQDKLTAGEGINITWDGIISATGTDSDVVVFRKTDISYERAAAAVAAGKIVYWIVGGNNEVYKFSRSSVAGLLFELIDYSGQLNGEVSYAVRYITPSDEKGFLPGTPDRLLTDLDLANIQPKLDIIGNVASNSTTKISADYYGLQVTRDNNTTKQLLLEGSDPGSTYGTSRYGGIVGVGTHSSSYAGLYLKFSGTNHKLDVVPQTNDDSTYNNFNLGTSAKKFTTLYANNLSDGTTTKTMADVLAQPRTRTYSINGLTDLQQYFTDIHPNITGAWGEIMIHECNAENHRSIMSMSLRLSFNHTATLPVGTALMTAKPDFFTHRMSCYGEATCTTGTNPTTVTNQTRVAIGLTSAILYLSGTFTTTYNTMDICSNFSVVMPE